MNILFLDQSGKLGGAELCLADIAAIYSQQCLVGLFADGNFRTLLERRQIPVRVLTTQPIHMRKDSGIGQGLKSIRQLLPLIQTVAALSQEFDVIYANTQKALIVGAIASLLSRRPLVYHLHDIVSPEHFSWINRQLIVNLANTCAAVVIANSQASRTAFIQAGGKPSLTQVIYNGFDPTFYSVSQSKRDRLRQDLQISDRFVIGHFSRLSPWKGQHVLIQALAQCPDEVVVLLVGDALFGEVGYVAQLQRQITALNLQHRVQFLKFRSDVPQLMAACDLIAHTSIAPEPFGRVIVEAMLANRPVIAAAAGGAIELVEPGKTGWLTAPNDAQALAAQIQDCYQHRSAGQAIAAAAHHHAVQTFHLQAIQAQTKRVLEAVVEGGAIAVS